MEGGADVLVEDALHLKGLGVDDDQGDLDDLLGIGVLGLAVGIIVAGGLKVKGDEVVEGRGRSCRTDCRIEHSRTVSCADRHHGRGSVGHSCCQEKRKRKKRVV